MTYSSRENTLLKCGEIEVDPSSYVDPQGFLFHYENNIYRCVRHEAVSFFQQLLDDGVLNELTRDNGLIAATPTELRLETESDGLVLSHPQIVPLSYCVEWCAGMLWEAARLTLELAISLADRDLILQDAYPWNVLFDGAQSVFVDLTSIAPSDPRSLWPAHEQFESYFVRPLSLMKEGKGQAVRALLLNNIEGINLESYARLSSAASLVRRPGVLFSRALERRLQSNPKLKNRTRSLAEKAVSNSTPAVRKRFLMRLREKLEPLRRRPQGDCWTNYYSEIDAEVDKQAKLSAIGELLDRLSSDIVLDLGCNTGVFSIEAAKRGARVFSVDSSESCIELLYDTAKRKNLNITPMIADIACPTPSFGFLARQYPPLFQRVRAETVLCLGLMHHLHINARQSLDRIATLMDEVCTSTLIFEYVGVDDANVLLLSTRRKIDYNLDSVKRALGRYFPVIESRDSDRPTRKLLVCQKQES